jgi:hypothetical protein
MSTREIFRARINAMGDIDRVAGEVRTAFITNTQGQQSVYLEKREEAQAYVAAHSANPSAAVPGPYVQREAEETGQSAIVVANQIVAQANFYSTQMSPLIEARRVAGKKRVREASDSLEDIEAERAAAVASITVLAAGLPPG